MRIIARSTLRKFWEAYPDAEQSLKAWFDEAFRAEWDSPADIKSTYRNAVSYILWCLETNRRKVP